MTNNLRALLGSEALSGELIQLLSIQLPLPRTSLVLSEGGKSYIAYRRVQEIDCTLAEATNAHQT